MSNTLKRNLFIMRKNYLTNVIFMIFSIPFWTITSNPLGSMNLTIPLMTYTSINIIEQLEDYYNYDCILNSLPVTREDIVRAKFESIIIIYLVNTALTLTAHLVYSALGVTEFITGQLFLMGLSMSFMISMIYAAAGTALICKYGYSKTKLYAAIMVLLTMATISIPIYMLRGSGMMLLSSAVSFAFGIAVYFVSQKFTMKIYCQKEF